MKNGFILICLSLLLFAPALAASDAAAVEAAERAFAAAVVQNDFEALDRILADDLYYSHSNWAEDTKSSFIEKLKSGAARYWALDILETNVRMIDASTAIVASVSLYETKGADGSRNRMRLKTLHLFRRNAGQWQLTAHQSAKKPE